MKPAAVLSWVALALVLGCAELPRPKVLDSAAAAAGSRPLVEARQRAPQVFARAEKLRAQAEEAYEGEHLGQADALGEQALAAYQRAVVNHRVGQATERLVLAQHELAETQHRLASLSSQNEALLSEVNALELRLKVIRDALPLAPLEPANPKREAARRSASLSLLETARLLCASAQLLDPENPGPKQILKEVDSLASAVTEAKAPTPVDQAFLLRTRCLEQLTLIRRPNRQQKPATDPADVLLSQLGSALPDSAPHRDDRGVVLTFSELFNGAALAEPGTQRLGQLAAIAKANPGFPVLLVVHGARADRGQGVARAATLQKALEQAGLARAKVHVADDRLPLGVHGIKGAKLQDERVEWVFVAR